MPVFPEEKDNQNQSNVMEGYCLKNLELYNGWEFKAAKKSFSFKYILVV